jgi:sirohydrochlorin ferrochelatase
VRVLLVAHGSRDPRAAATTRALAVAVERLRPGVEVRVAFLDHTQPSVPAALRAMGDDGVAVVPLLLTSAYHARVDLPMILEEFGGGTGAELTEVLGPVDGPVPVGLLAGLRRRVRETGTRYDALVLAAAGTRDAAALSTVDEVAAALGAASGVPCLSAYASAASPGPGEAVAALRAGGAGRVAVASYFLATGQLYRGAVESSLAAGAVAVAQPLGDAVEIARLVLDRVAAISGPAAGQSRFLLTPVGM